MLERTTRRTIVFSRAFHLDGIDRELPAGAYVVETDEELIPGLSFIAYRRVRTTITLPLQRASVAARQVVTIEPADLDAAIARDRNPDPVV